MVLRTSVIVFTLFSSICATDVDLDYYYSTGLRTDSTLQCKNRMLQYFCQIKCSIKPALCVKDVCYCVTIAMPNIEISEGKGKADSMRNNKAKYKNSIEESANFEDFSSPEQKINLDMMYSQRPTVRHHIAHFCPNLDVARTCIRKCMAEGKPAFCGKDHVCYCGHKYTHTAKDNGGDAKELYAQFKDLYEKYFGPNYGKEDIET